MYLKNVDHDPYDPHQHDFGCYVIFKGKMQSFTLQIFYIPHLTGAHLTGCLLQFFFIQMLYLSRYLFGLHIIGQNTVPY